MNAFVNAMFARKNRRLFLQYKAQDFNNLKWIDELEKNKKGRQL